MRAAVLRMGLAIAVLGLCAAAEALERTFPGEAWESRAPAEVGLGGAELDAIADLLGGRGCVVRHGYLVKTWGGPAERGDWLSSAKPVFSTLLFFAVQEGLIGGPLAPIADFGWELSEKDRGITFFHLAHMISGYARPEKPGEAWAYNDYAINLYRLTLFERLFKADPLAVTLDDNRLGALRFQDGLSFNERARIFASPRDFARLGWFWLNRGNWNGRQLLNARYFDELLKPHVPENLPHTAEAETDDDLGIGTYGGGSDHFTDSGPGIYGYNFWFNAEGREHPDALTWPDGPENAFMTIGAGGNSSVIIPSLDMVIAAARADWGSLRPGDRSSAMNRVMKLAAEADAAGGGAAADSRGVVIEDGHTAMVRFNGPRHSESDSDPNPFLDYRLQVTFADPSGKTHEVPGYFDGDGAGGAAGGVWTARFTPDESGRWTFEASFRKGPAVAASLDSEAGEPVAFDGASGAFDMPARDANAPGFLKWSRLESVNAHYLKFRNGPWWLKGGCDSPEDMLAYKGFHNTPAATHEFAAHVRDWRPGDPDWGGGAGRGIIGALNYLASEEVNSIYLMPNNIGGDGKNVWPYVGPIDGTGSPDNDNLHFDVRKMRQWNTVFSHAQRLGIFLHIVLNEAERPNKLELDNAQLGIERKLYYRELIARFGHHPALQWNLCEEYNLYLAIPPETVKEFAAYIRAVDPYGHPITVHHARSVEEAWTPFLGDPLFTVISFQIRTPPLVDEWRERSAAAGVPLVIGMDEFHPDHAAPDYADRHRLEYIWPIYLSGGQLEFILDGLLETEDFRRYEGHWRYMRIARRFMEEHLPFWEMRPMDGLLEAERGRGEAFAKPGEIYALYLPEGGSAILDLGGAAGAKFTLRWFDPRAGAFVGDERTVQGGGKVSIGPPPAGAELDWVVLLER